MSTLKALFAASLLVLPSLGTVAASAQQDVQGLFGETVAVQVVNVEVVVTDRSGKRVEGLEALDFRLLVDGVETSIDHFTEIREGVMARQDVAFGEPTLASPGLLVGTNYLVFIDDFFAIGSQRDLVVGQVRESLGSLRPADRMAIVAYDGMGLEVLADWTSDRSLLEQALDRAGERRAMGLHRDPERRRRGLVRQGGGLTIAGDELEMEVSAIVAAIRAMPRPEGRNVLMLLAGAWPTGPRVGSSAGLPTLARSRILVDDHALLRPIVETANLLGYTIYPVDLPGLRGDSQHSFGSIAGSRSPLGYADSVWASGANRPFGSNVSIGSTRGSQASELLRMGSLRRVAMETGGQAILAGDRLSSLQRVVDDTRSYYWIGFSPERQHDGSLHAIEVDVSQPGLEVRARSTYRDLTRRVELATKLESELLLKSSEAQSPLRVTLGEVQRNRWQKMTVAVAVDIPWQEITLLPIGEQLVGQAELRFGVKDDRGVLSHVATAPLNLTRASGNEDSDFHYETNMLLRREAHQLVVSLYDAGSGRTVSESVRIEP